MFPSCMSIKQPLISDLGRILEIYTNLALPKYALKKTINARIFNNYMKIINNNNNNLLFIFFIYYFYLFFFKKKI